MLGSSAASGSSIVFAIVALTSIISPIGFLMTTAGPTTERTQGVMISMRFQKSAMFSPASLSNGPGTTANLGVWNASTSSVTWLLISVTTMVAIFSG
ncbi:hypothetical protein D3C80_1482560 [compost metagenome]